jgi:para-nitrobenzyl esterase
MFRIPAIRLIEAALAHNPRAYLYSFDWGSPPLAGKLGAGHAFELPFMWDTLGALPPGAFSQWVGKEAPQALATTVHGAWASFIKTGTPQHPNLPEWPPYDPLRRATMVLDTQSRVVEDPETAERQLWDQVRY